MGCDRRLLTGGYIHTSIMNGSRLYLPAAARLDRGARVRGEEQQKSSPPSPFGNSQPTNLTAQVQEANATHPSILFSFFSVPVFRLACPRLAWAWTHIAGKGFEQVATDVGSPSTMTRHCRASYLPKLAEHRIIGLKWKGEEKGTKLSCGLGPSRLYRPQEGGTSPVLRTGLRREVTCCVLGQQTFANDRQPNPEPPGYGGDRHFFFDDTRDRNCRGIVVSKQ